MIRIRSVGHIPLDDVKGRFTKDSMHEEEVWNYGELGFVG